MTLAEAFDCDVIEAKEKLLKEESFILGPQVVFNRAVVPTSPASSNSDSSSSVVDEKIEPLPPQDDVEPLKEATGKNVIFFRL
jgi:hypothetical protein